MVLRAEPKHCWNNLKQGHRITENYVINRRLTIKLFVYLSVELANRESRRLEDLAWGHYHPF